MIDIISSSILTIDFIHQNHHRINTIYTSKNSSFRNVEMDRQQLERLKQSGKEQLQRLIGIVSLERFSVFEQNKRKLDQSLLLLGRTDLIGKTLLDEKIHLKHSRGLNELFLKELKQVRKNNLDDRENIRFVTIIHSVTELDDDSGIVESLRLKKLLTSVLNTYKNDFSFIGVIEGEVINIEKLRRFGKENPDYDSRKLTLCESLSENITKESSLLIHIHGMLFSKNGKGFDEIENGLREIWNYGYQVELKKTYKQNKTEKNLRNISSYITKGGQEWDNDTISLKYKMGFTNEDIDTQIAYHGRQRQQEVYDVESGLVDMESIEDTMSLNANEITGLASFVDKLMRLDSENTGYRLIIKR